VGRFLHYYARYLAGEKQREEERIERVGALGRCEVPNKQLPALEVDLRRELGLHHSNHHHHHKQCRDPFLLYVLSLVLIDTKKTTEARLILLESLAGYPCNWSAWLAFQGLAKQERWTVPDARGFLSESSNHSLPSLRSHWIVDLFMASLSLEVLDNNHAIKLATDATMVGLLPTSSSRELIVASAHYQLRQYGEAQEFYERLMESDPYRIEGCDCFSNILYTQELLPELATLARRLVSIDKYRPETQCVVGNYYSLRNDHHRAVAYYRRALRLNPHYLSAWTLMGHELLELKKVGAAVEAYRRAVDIDPRDFRAWYGLGMVYELMKQQYYALHYFKKAAQLRPHDARMWCAVAQSYESDQLKMYDAAIRCYHRAVTLDDPDGVALSRLAKLHSDLNDRDEAAHYHQLLLDRLDGVSSNPTKAPAAATAAAGLDPLSGGGGSRSPTFEVEGDDAEAGGAPAARIAGTSTVDLEGCSESLLFLSRYYLDEGKFAQAEAYATRLLDVGGADRERAKILLKEIRSTVEQQDVKSAATAVGVGMEVGSTTMDTAYGLPQQQQTMMMMTGPSMGGGGADTGNVYTLVPGGAQSDVSDMSADSGSELSFDLCE